MQVNHQIHKTQTMIETLQARLQDLANVAAKHKGISLAELANRALEQIASIENWRTRILRLCIVRRRSQRRCKWSMDDQGLWSLGPDDYHRQIRHQGPISSVSLVIGMNIGIDHFLDLGLVSQESQFWRYIHRKDTSGPEKESQQFKLRSGLMICGGKYGRKWPKTLNEKQGRKNPAGRCTTIDSCFFFYISLDGQEFDTVIENAKRNLELVQKHSWERPHPPKKKTQMLYLLTKLIWCPWISKMTYQRKRQTKGRRA